MEDIPWVHDALEILLVHTENKVIREWFVEFFALHCDGRAGKLYSIAPLSYFTKPVKGQNIYIALVVFPLGQNRIRLYIFSRSSSCSYYGDAEELRWDHVDT